MPPWLRKAVLTLHVATSVGWFGAVLAYLALDITTVANDDPPIVRGAYIGMAATVTYAIVPLALASVLIGIINALGTTWGLFRHYWVVVKLVLTVIATLVLLLEAGSVAYLADVANTASTDPRTLSSTLPHSIGGLMILFTTLILSTYKPRGLTRHGWRRQQAKRSSISRAPDQASVDTAQ